MKHRTVYIIFIFILSISMMNVFRGLPHKSPQKPVNEAILNDACVESLRYPGTPVNFTYVGPYTFYIYTLYRASDFDGLAQITGTQAVFYGHIQINDVSIPGVGLWFYPQYGNASTPEFIFYLPCSVPENVTQIGFAPFQGAAN